MIEEKQRFTFSEYECDMFKRCAENGDMNEWNTWRKNNPKVIPQLFGFDFRRIDWFSFMDADLTGAIFINCDFEKLYIAFLNNLAGSQFIKCNLDQAHFAGTNLPRVVFKNISNLQKTLFTNCDLKNSTFSRCNLNSSSFIKTDLRGACFFDCDLRHLNTQYIIVDRKTHFDKCTFDADSQKGEALCHH